MRKSLLSVSAFSFASAAIGFAINVILARYFNVDVFGRINLLLSISIILHTFLDFGFSTTLVIFVNKNINNSNTQNQLISLVNCTYARFFLGLLVIAVLTILSLSYLYNLSNLELLFLLINSIFIALYRYLISFQQAIGNWKTYNYLTVLNNFLKFLILFLGAVFVIYIGKQKVLYNHFLLFFICYSVLLFVITTRYSKNFLSKDIGKTLVLKDDLKSILYPLAASNVIIILAMRIDVLMIEKVLGEQMVGIYAAANVLAFAFPIITNSIMKVLLKEVSGKGKEYLAKILSIQKKYFLHFIGLLILIELLAPYIILIIFGEKYEQSINIFQVLLIAYFGGVFFTPIESYFYGYKSKYIFYVKTIQFLIILMTGLLLIHYYSLIGISIAILLSRIFAWIFFTYKANVTLE